MTRTVSTRSISVSTRPVPTVVSLQSVSISLVEKYLVHASRQAIGIHRLETMLQIERLGFDSRRYIAIARDCRKRIVCLLITAPDTAHIEYAELALPLPFRRAIVQSRQRSLRFEVRGYSVVFSITDSSGCEVYHQYHIQHPSGR